jgi:hypothetical protein
MYVVWNRTSLLKVARRRRRRRRNKGEGERR